MTTIHHHIPTTDSDRAPVEQAIASCQSIWPQGTWQIEAHAGDCFGLVGTLPNSLVIELENMPEGAIAELRIGHTRLARSSNQKELAWQHAIWEIAEHCLQLAQALTPQAESWHTSQKPPPKASQGYLHPTEGWQSGEWPD